LKLKRTYILILTLILANCSQSPESTAKSPLETESKIIALFKDSLTEVTGKIKDAELHNRLQEQLDYKRIQCDLITRLNKALDGYSKTFVEGREITFEQYDKSAAIVRSVKLIGCRFKEEIMDVETYLLAHAEISNPSINFIRAKLINASGKSLGNFQFAFTNEYPELNKELRLFAHPGNFQSIKNFEKVVFY
jgi:hypothetical protein